MKPSPAACDGGGPRQPAGRRGERQAKQAEEPLGKYLWHEAWQARGASARGGCGAEGRQDAAGTGPEVQVTAGSPAPSLIWLQTPLVPMEADVQAMVVQLLGLLGGFHGEEPA